MNVLLLGSGGREHALAWKLAQSPILDTLYISPGNGGTSNLGLHVTLDTTDHSTISAFCKKNAVELVVVGPEAPLVDGLANHLHDHDIAVFGPSKDAAQLEGSKHFTKEICDKMAVPTAGYGHFTSLDAARDYITRQGAPIVIKADGLAAGKGVTVAMTLEEAIAAVEDCFSGSFGEAGAEVVVEEFLDGEEASMFFICDGKTALPFGTAQDHKRVGDGDTGPNTGGMGAYSPAPVLTESVQQKILQTIVLPTLRGMEDMGMPFSGVLYAGLMVENGQPKLIEYNVRFGDPECQVLMTRLESDLLPVLLASAQGNLADIDVRWSNDAALTVVMAADGYPGKYQKGSRIDGLDDVQNATVFHAGTEVREGRTLAIGGRVLCVTAKAKSVADAQRLAYEAVDTISWPDGFCRRDIGWRAVEREKNA